MDGFEYEFVGGTRRIFQYNGTLYEDTGSAFNTISSGWSAPAITTFIGLKDYLLVHQAAKRVLLRMPVATMIEENFDLAAPSSVGVAVASSATAGALVAGLFHTIYIVNENNTTGRQSGPIGPFTVQIAPAQTSYDINTLPAAPADAQFTHFKLYRTAGFATAALAQAATPLFSQRYAVAAAGTLVNDGIADSALFVTDPLPQSVNGDYFVGTPPNTTSSKLMVSYRGMILQFFYRGVVAFTQPGFDDRWSTTYRVQVPMTDFDLTAGCESDGVVVAASSRELFLISGSGTFGGSPPIADWTVRRISSDYGVYNQKCLVNFGGSVYGLGQGGPFVVDSAGVRPMKKPVRDDRMKSAPGYFSPTTTSSVIPCLGFRQADRTLWANVPIIDTKAAALAPNAVVAVYPVDEVGKVGYYDHQITSFMGRGRRSFRTGGSDHSAGFFACDSWGNCLELETGENDGAANSTGYAIVSAVVDSAAPNIQSITHAVVSPAPVRGTRVVVLPNDHTKPPEVGSVLERVDSTHTQVHGLSSDAYATGSTMYFGGILALYETGAMFLAASDEGGFAAFGLNQLRLFLNDLAYDEADNPPGNPLVLVQVKVDDGDWGTRVTAYDGSVFPTLGKAIQPKGKNAASGKSDGGYTVRIRFIAPAADKPVRPYAMEHEVSPLGTFNRKVGA